MSRKSVRGNNRAGGNECEARFSPVEIVSFRVVHSGTIAKVVGMVATVIPVVTRSRNLSPAHASRSRAVIGCRDMALNEVHRSISNFEYTQFGRLISAPRHSQVKTAQLGGKSRCPRASDCGNTRNQYVLHLVPKARIRQPDNDRVSSKPSPVAYVGTTETSNRCTHFKVRLSPIQ
jgi:hypothetical protein